MRRDPRVPLLALFGAAATLSGAAAFVVLGLLALDAATASLRRRELPCRPPAFGAALAFALWGLLMVAFSSDPAFSLIMAKRFLVLLALGAGACLMTDPERRLLTAGAVIAGGAANALWTLATQEFAWDLTGRRVTMVQGSATTGAWILGLAAVTALAFGVTLPRRRVRLLALSALAPLLAALALSQTRSAWLGLGAALAVMLGVSRRRGAALALAVVLAVAALGPSALRERAVGVGDPQDTAVSVRVKQWRVALELVAWRPVTGVGDVYLSDLARIRTGYVDRLDADMHHLHHSLLTAAVFWGVPGAAFFLLLMGTLLWRLTQAWRGPPADASLRAWTLAGLGAWTFYFTAGWADALLVDQETTLLFLLVTGAGVIPRSTGDGSPPAALPGGPARP